VTNFWDKISLLTEIKTTWVTHLCWVGFVWKAACLSSGGFQVFTLGSFLFFLCGGNTVELCLRYLFEIPAGLLDIFIEILNTFPLCLQVDIR